jgi:hypothetical protein
MGFSMQCLYIAYSAVECERQWSLLIFISFILQGFSLSFASFLLTLSSLFPFPSSPFFDITERILNPISKGSPSNGHVPCLQGCLVLRTCVFSSLRKMRFFTLIQVSEGESEDSCTVRRKTFAQATAFVFYRSLSPATEGNHFFSLFLPLSISSRQTYSLQLHIQKLWRNSITSHYYRTWWILNISFSSEVSPALAVFRPHNL